jgi:hypothetical protein
MVALSALSASTSTTSVYVVEAPAASAVSPGVRVSNDVPLGASNPASGTATVTAVSELLVRVRS